MKHKQIDAGKGRSRLSLAATVAAFAIGIMLPVHPAQAQKLVEISGEKRSAVVNVAIGKSADMRTDVSFSDVTVGDPEIADVNVLTDRSL